MDKTRTNFLKYFFQTYYINSYFSLMQLFYFLSYISHHGVNTFTNDLPSAGIFLFSFVTLNIFIYILNQATFRLSSMRVPFFTVLLFIVNLLYAYHYQQKNSFDYSMIADNTAETFNLQSFYVITTRITVTNILYAGISLVFFVGLYLLFIRRTKVVFHLKRFGAAIFLYALILIVPCLTYDESTFFLKSIIDYYRSSSLYRVNSTEQYPFIHSFRTSANPTSKKKNIFLIMVESLNGNFIERRNASGREFTPFLNSLIKQGLYIENYYSNSIQTSRSQFSTLTSVLPSFRGKEFADYLNVNYYTIAQALKENSYYTIFFQALEDLRFDNTDKFMNKNGFDEVLTFKKYKKPGDEKNYYSWGVSDNVFFARFFDFLNDVKNNNKSNKPLFMLLATIGNHMNCDRIKPNERTFYKEPKNTFECYCNSVYVTDSALKYFFETIKKDSIFNNSIFIVTGDHPYPLGEHGFANNEASFYEEFYKIPLVMIGNGINPKRITDMAYSHLDLAPTIADLAGISLDRVPWQGISMVQQEKCHHPVYFIQPYSGRYTTVLDYPLKYTKRLRTGDEYLFNLKTDPQEQCNLIRNNDYLKNIVQLREELKTIFLNQRMLEENRIWNGK